MRLNPDCLREVLLTLENELTLNDNFKPVRYSSKKLLESNLNQSFDDKEIIYSLIQLSKSGYIEMREVGADQYFAAYITDITPLGHNLLNNIRPKSNWDKVLSVVKNTSNYSLSALSTIAINIGESQLNDAITTLLNHSSK